ncbi:MAG: hypothetical protein ACYCYI_05345 [Saccharofermentanales bacterium]
MKKFILIMVSMISALMMSSLCFASENISTSEYDPGFLNMNLLPAVPLPLVILIAAACIGIGFALCHLGHVVKRQRIEKKGKRKDKMFL